MSEAPPSSIIEFVRRDGFVSYVKHPDGPNNIRQELSATEDEVRSKKMVPGMGYSFYLKLAQVLQRLSSPPPPIPIPQRNI
jgi:hypothetical protein